MSIQKKTLAVLITAALGVSFGASAGDRNWGGGGYEDPECCTGGTNTNDDGNQAVDNSAVLDLDYRRLTKTINKDILNGWDNSVRLKVDTNINHQSNFTFQGGHTGNTNSVSLAGSYAGSQAGNLGLMGQHSQNGALGAGVGFGAGLGAASSEADGGGTNGNFPPRPHKGGRYGGHYGGHEGGGGDVESGDAGGAGFGAGMGMGVGWAKLTADQDLDQSAAAFSHSSAFSVSMIKSGNNTLGNSGSMHGINVQQGISGHSSMGNQSVNVNGSVQF